MASIDIAPGPAPDTARAEGVWSKIRYHAGAYPLGLVGAAIMAVFVLAAIFADVITVIGIEAAFLIGGLIVTETVFNIPGVARFLVEAIRWRDYPIVQNLVMFIAVVAVLVNFLVDLLYAVLDPRIKYS